ncbi:MAG TPA: hypothetical protein VF533_00745 [Solirubrobacteraceae bacterium]
MSTNFDVVDLSQRESLLQGEDMATGSVNLEDLRGQLEEIRDALSPVVTSPVPGDGLRLESLELDLTVGLEGRVWFIAKGKGEASLRMKWSRGS